MFSRLHRAFDRRYQRLRNRLDRHLVAGKPWEISLFFDFAPPPRGGGNQFMWCMRREFAKRDFSLGINAISKSTQSCLFNSYNFDFDRLRRMRREGCRMVHRVDGPLKAYRGSDDGTDGLISEINMELADATIFQSEFSLQCSRELGLEFRNPVIVRNTVDRTLFIPPTEHTPLDGRKVKIISTSWSANPRKGAAVYQWLDENLDFSRFEYTFVGRSNVEFKNIRLVDPQPSEGVARLLREHDLYITASIKDPCSNSLLEAMACGLPAIHLNSGGHPELVGEAGFGFDEPEEIPALLDHLTSEMDERRAKISLPTLEETATRYLEVMGMIK